jgi:hypothetical protein
LTPTFNVPLLPKLFIAKPFLRGHSAHGSCSGQIRTVAGIQVIGKRGVRAEGGQERPRSGLP